jgi:hypothetical protein
MNMLMNKKNFLYFCAFLIFTATMPGIALGKKTKTEDEEVKVDTPDSKPEKKPEKVKPVPPEKAHYTRDTLKEYFKKLTENIKKSYKNPNEFSYRNIEMCANEVNKWQKSEYLELDTERYLWWYQKLEKVLTQMGAAKKTLHFSILEKDTKKYYSALKAYKDQVNVYRGLFNKKTLEKANIPEKQLVELRKNIRQKEREARRRRRR